MTFLPKLPHKIQYLASFSFSFVSKLCEKTEAEKFVVGRKGYDKELLFFLLLMKKVTNWSFRTVSEMGGISHSTLVRANAYFLEKHIYEKFSLYLVKLAYKRGLIHGKYVAMDASFVQTFSRKEELGSEAWNDFKKAYGFKLHLLIDCETKFPIGIKVTNGLASDNTLAISLLKNARWWLKRCGYVIADKGYDDGDIVNWIAKKLHAKAGIPIKKHKRGKNYSWEGSWRNFQQKAKGRTLKKSIYNRRTAIERVFSVIKRTYHLGKEETRGILNFAKNVYLTLICYMLKLFDIAKIS
jgi:hypothetical protein